MSAPPQGRRSLAKAHPGRALVVAGLVHALGSPAVAGGVGAGIVMRDSVVDAAALNFPDGKYGTCVNGQTFQQEAVVSFKGREYAAYFADGGVPCLARRGLPGAAWEVLRFEDYRMGSQHDAHNVVTVGICHADGTIHLAYDHHVNTLHYRRSVGGAALEPGKFAWTRAVFGPTTSRLEEGGEALQAVTYPMFFSTPQGKLQLLYRTGASGDGDWHLAEYDPATGWTILGVLLSGKGVYENSDSRCAYPNPLRYGADGRLHLTWCWRERPRGEPLDLRTNHDLCYAYSDDFGRTWKNNAGREIASLRPGHASTPIDIGSPGTVVRATRFRWGQMNTTTQFVDAGGRVHVLNWQNPPDAEAGSPDKNRWRYFYYHGAAGEKWSEARLPFFGRKPQIVLDRAGTAWVVFTKGDQLDYGGRVDPGGVLTIARAGKDSGRADWKIVWQSDRLFVGEPLIDQDRWREEGVLSVYAQEKPARAGAPSALHVLDFYLGEDRRAPVGAGPLSEPVQKRSGGLRVSRLKHCEQSATMAASITPNR